MFPFMLHNTNTILQNFQNTDVFKKINHFHIKLVKGDYPFKT